MIGRVAQWLFGGRNSATDLIEVFKENSEAGARRDADLRHATLAQYAAEFRASPPSRFNAFMDGVNRLPRPALALGTIALFISAMFEPQWFSQRMQGLAQVPEPMWWLMGVVVSFYFGARHQAKEQEQIRKMVQGFQAETTQKMQTQGVDAPDMGTEDAQAAYANPALEAWQRKNALRN